MNYIPIETPSYLEIIFANKNKSYGAYQLRKDNNRRMAHATLTAVVSISLILFVLAYTNQKESLSTKPVLKVVELGPTPPMDKTRPQKIPSTPSAPPPKSRQIKYTPPKVTVDHITHTNDNPNTADLQNASI